MHSSPQLFSQISLTRSPLNPSAPPSHCSWPITFRRTRLPATRPPPQQLWLAEFPGLDPPSQAAAADDGPIELPPSSSSSLFSNSDDPTPLQLSTSVLLTGAISVFLFRSLRRRAKRAKEMRVRSTGVEKAKSLKEEAMDSLKAMGSASLESGAPPSPAQAFLGGLAAGVVAVILYKFSATVEAGLNRQSISDNFSVRQITITIRTIITGLCYLATFVFGVNSVGLLLYSGQLAVSSLMETSSDNSAPGTQGDGQPDLSPTKSLMDNVEATKVDVKNSDET